MDSVSNNQSESSNNNEEEVFQPNDTSTQAFQHIRKYHGWGEGLYDLTYTQHDDSYSINIEFLTTIPVRRGEEREIEINNEAEAEIPEFNHFGIITVKYPGIARGTHIYKNTKDKGLIVSIPKQQEPLAELYYELLPHEPNIANDLITGYKTSIVGFSYNVYPVIYYNLSNPSNFGDIFFYEATFCHTQAVPEFSANKLLNQGNISCDLLGYYSEEYEEYNAILLGSNVDENSMEF